MFWMEDISTLNDMLATIHFISFITKVYVLNLCLLFQIQALYDCGSVRYGTVRSLYYELMHNNCYSNLNQTRLMLSRNLKRQLPILETIYHVINQ